MEERMQFSAQKQLQKVLYSKQSKAIKYLFQTIKTGVQKYTMHNIAVLAVSLIFKKVQLGYKKIHSARNLFTIYLKL